LDGFSGPGGGLRRVVAPHQQECGFRSTPPVLRIHVVEDVVLVQPGSSRDGSPSGANATLIDFWKI
jgi:hypothetical protein